MMRLKKLFVILGVLSTTCLVGALVFNHPLQVAYHNWRMHADFNRVFGKPQSTDGLTSIDVTNIDVNQVLGSYASHRDSLVSLGTLSHLSGSYPWLKSDGSLERSKARSEFAERMWQRFPDYRFYQLDEDGLFSVWAPTRDKDQWQAFLDSEAERFP